MWKNVFQAKKRKAYGVSNDDQIYISICIYIYQGKSLRHFNKIFGLLIFFFRFSALMMRWYLSIRFCIRTIQRYFIFNKDRSKIRSKHFTTTIIIITLIIAKRPRSDYYHNQWSHGFFLSSASSFVTSAITSSGILRFVFQYIF